MKRKLNFDAERLLVLKRKLYFKAERAARDATAAAMGLETYE